MSANIYQRVFKSPGMIRLVSHSALLRILPEADLSGWLPHCLAEMIQRAWLLRGGGAHWGHFEHFKRAWLDHGFPNELVDAISGWCLEQQHQRSFELPAAWNRDSQPATREILRHLIASWQNADSMVVFVRTVDDPDVNPATALPFEIANHAREMGAYGKGEEPNGLNLTPAIERAFTIAVSSKWAREDWKPSLHFNTLIGNCDLPLEGLSACLPVLAALRFRSKGLRLSPLHTAFSGLLTKSGCLESVEAPALWEAKRHLIQQIGARSVLPGDPEWPTGEPVMNALNEMLAELRGECEPATRIPVPSRAEPQKYPFDSYLNEKKRRFVGREWLLEKIDLWPYHGDERALVIVGEPGFGKSSIVAQFVHLNPGGQVIAHHCCQADETETLNPGRFVQSIAAMLADQLPEYDDCLAEPQVMAALSGENAAAALSVGIIEPLGRIKAPKDGVRYVVIDALDEAALHKGSVNIVDVLFDRVERLPSWLRIVATTRNDSAVLNYFSAARRIELDAADPKNIADLDAYIRMRLQDKEATGLAEKLVESQVPVETIISILSDRSGGNFLYAVQALKGVLHDHYSFKQLKELPQGLEGLYLRFFERVFGRTREAGFESHYGVARPLLQVMIAAREPLTPEELAAASGMDAEEELPSWLRRLGQFISQGLRDNEKTFTLYHQSIADWLRSDKHDFHVSEKKGDHRLAIYCASFENDLEALPDYVLLNGIFHFTEVGYWDRATAWLLDLNFIAARVRSGEIGALQSDYNLVLESHPDGQAERNRERGSSDKLERWGGELLDYSRQATNRRALSVPDDSLTIPRLCPPEVVPRCTDKERQRLSDNSSQLEKLRAFKRFVALNADALVRFATYSGFVLQTALNSAPSGPVNDAAKAQSESLPESKGAPMLLREWEGHEVYNPTPACLRVMPWKHGEVSTVAIAPDGRTFISGDEAGNIVVWDLEIGAPLYGRKVSTSGLKRLTRCDNEIFVLDREMHLRIWKLDDRTGVIEGPIAEAPSKIQAMTATPDGALALMCAQDGVKTIHSPAHSVTIMGAGLDFPPSDRETPIWNLRLWDRRRNATPIVREDCDKIFALDMTPDGQVVVAAGGLRSQIWNLENKRHPHGPSFFGEACCVTITPDGRWVALGGSGGTVALLDLAAIPPPPRPLDASIFDRIQPRPYQEFACDRLVWACKEHNGAVTCVQITPDGTRAISGGQDGTLRLWDLQDLRQTKCEYVFEGHFSGIIAVSMTADGRLAVSSSKDGTLRVWDLEKGISDARSNLAPEEDEGVQEACRPCFPAGLIKLMNSLGEQWWEITAHVISPDGHKIITAHDDATVRVWNSETAECLKTFHGHERQPGRRGHQVPSLAISPDGRFAVSASRDKTVRVWNLNSLSQAAELVLRGHVKSVWCVAISPDGRRILSGDREGTLREWDRETGACRREVKSWPFVSKVCFALDGKCAVAWGGGYGGRLDFWDFSAGKHLGIALTNCDSVQSIKMIADGERFILDFSSHSGYQEKGIAAIWDWESRTELDWFTCSTKTADDSIEVLGGGWGSIRALDVRSGAFLWEREDAHDGQIKAIALTPDAKFVLSVGSDMSIGVWKMSSGECVQRLKFDDNPESQMVVDHAGISFGGQRFRWVNLCD